MSNLKTIARPYAKAVFSQADSKVLQKSWWQFLQLTAKVAEDPKMQSYLGLPGFVDELISWIDQWLKDERKKGLTREEKNFLTLLAENDRLMILPEIASFYENLMYEQQDVCVVKVRSAQKMRAKDKQTLKETLTKTIGRKVQLAVSEDADLIAGVIIEYDGKVIDQTLKGRISRLARSLD